MITGSFIGQTTVGPKFSFCMLGREANVVVFSYLGKLRSLVGIRTVGTFQQPARVLDGRITSYRRSNDITFLLVRMRSC